MLFPRNNSNISSRKLQRVLCASTNSTTVCALLRLLKVLFSDWNFLNMPLESDPDSTPYQRWQHTPVRYANAYKVVYVGNSRYLLDKN